MTGRNCWKLPRHRKTFLLNDIIERIMSLNVRPTESELSRCVMTVTSYINNKVLNSSSAIPYLTLVEHTVWCWAEIRVCKADCVIHLPSKRGEAAVTAEDIIVCFFSPPDPMYISVPKMQKCSQVPDGTSSKNNCYASAGKWLRLPFKLWHDTYGSKDPTMSQNMFCSSRRNFWMAWSAFSQALLNSLVRSDLAETKHQYLSEETRATCMWHIVKHSELAEFRHRFIKNPGLYLWVPDVLKICFKGMQKPFISEK